jgi:hypothetical protein
MTKFRFHSEYKAETKESLLAGLLQSRDLPRKTKGSSLLPVTYGAESAYRQQWKQGGWILQELRTKPAVKTSQVL